MSVEDNSIQSNSISMFRQPEKNSHNNDFDRGREVQNKWSDQPSLLSWIDEK
jgi:hypothetical protein